MHLYEISDKIEMIFADETVFDPETGALTEIGVTALQELEEDAERTGLEIACYIKGMLLESAAVKIERERLQKREKGLKDRAESLKAYLSMHLSRAGFKKTRLANGKACITWGTAKSVLLSNEALIPKEYFEEVKTIKLRKDLMRIHLMDGNEVPGAQLAARDYVVLK